jgi:hypothetical protein
MPQQKPKITRPRLQATTKLYWEETAREIAEASEDWAVWDVTSADGLKRAPWEPAAKRGR